MAQAAQLSERTCQPAGGREAVCRTKTGARMVATKVSSAMTLLECVVLTHREMGLRKLQAHGRCRQLAYPSQLETWS